MCSSWVFLLKNLWRRMELSRLIVWDDDESYLWFARLYPVCASHEAALDAAAVLYRMTQGSASPERIRKWKESERMSLYSSFNSADIAAAHRWEG